MLFLTIVDAEIELVPEEIATHEVIIRRAKRRRVDPTEMLLDSNMDHRGMARLQDGTRRGRPDITHVCLLNALDSIPCREGRMGVYVHTRQDIVMGFDPKTRIPRSQNRFYGLLEKLLSEGKGTELITVSRMSVRQLQKQLAPDLSLGFSRKGERVDLRSMLSGEGKIMAMVGGFPSGYFRSPVEDIARVVRCHDQPVDAWTVVNEIICAYRWGQVG